MVVVRWFNQTVDGQNAFLLLRPVFRFFPEIPLGGSQTEHPNEGKWVFLRDGVTEEFWLAVELGHRKRKLREGCNYHVCKRVVSLCTVSGNLTDGGVTVQEYGR